LFTLVSGKNFFHRPLGVPCYLLSVICYFLIIVYSQAYLYSIIKC
jgi:hypothetical protein